MRPDRVVVQLIVAAVFVVYLAWLIVERQSLRGTTNIWGVAVSVAWIAWVVLDRWAWRWRFVNWIAGGRPDVQGTWRGSLVSEYKESTGNRVPEDPEVYLVVRETFSTASASLLTPESKSETIVGSIQHSDGGTARFVGVYRNIPRSSVLHRSAIHHGALILDIEGSPPTTLDGRYWTERGDRGELHLSAHVRKLVGSHDEGRTLAWQDGDNTIGSATSGEGSHDG